MLYGVFMLGIRAGRIITPFVEIEEGLVVVENSKIIYVGKEKDFPESYDKEIDASDKILIPGLIDIHIHGANGADIMDGKSESIKLIADFLVKNGTVAFLPATVTAPLDEIFQALDAVRKAKEENTSGAKILGVHMEGPYISREKAGSQDVRYIREPKLEELKEIIQRYRDIILRITIAPEVKGGIDAIRYLVQEGVIVSLGYTNANFQYAMRAFNLGAKLVSHIFNAMRGFHHRDPGIIGAALLRNDIFAELIPDGIHVNPVVMKIVYKLKGYWRLILVTNSIMVTGLPDGKYKLPKGLVIIKDGAARLPSGILVGSTLTMNQAVKNAIKFLGCSLREAIYMATYSPARALNITNEFGSIEVGKKANLAIIDENLNVYYTIIDGKIVYQK